jgi:hypothetical protein
MRRIRASPKVNLSYNHLNKQEGGDNRHADLPSKRRLGSFSLRVSRTRAAFLQRIRKEEKIPELGEGQLASPDLSLVFQTVSADQSQSKMNASK